MVKGAAGLEEMRAQIDQISWWHKIALPGGIVTPGIDLTHEKLPFLGLPNRMDGKRVLDVGCWDGFFSFLAEQRGASEVVAIDVFKTRGFEFAHQALGSRVRFEQMAVYDVTPQALGTFDLVFFFGVYYHLRNPVLALDRLSAVTRERLLIESAVGGAEDQSTARFCEEDECHNDPTVWWIPSVECLVRTARAAGFPRVEVANLWAGRMRAVVHAWKTPGTACKTISEDIYLGIDAPAADATLSGEFVVQGWSWDRRSVAGSKIDRVSVYLDGPEDIGKPLGDASLGLPNAGVARWAGEAVQNCGFQLVLDARKLPKGRHVLYIAVHSTDSYAQRAMPVKFGR
jgi:tRNA (mo5U34)-methyltransferase